MSDGLNRKEMNELTNLLRKNLLYQTPQPFFENEADENPKWVGVRISGPHYLRVMELIGKVGGWVLSRDQRFAVYRQHEERARCAYGGGVDYDLSDVSFGDLAQMYTELEGIEEMADFHQAIGEVLDLHKQEKGN